MDGFSRCGIPSSFCLFYHVSFRIVFTCCSFLSCLHLIFFLADCINYCVLCGCNCAFVIVCVCVCVCVCVWLCMCVYVCMTCEHTRLYDLIVSTLCYVISNDTTLYYFMP